MFRRFLKFTAFLFLAIIVHVQSHDLFLAFFVFFPLLLLPVFYFFDELNRKIFYAALSLTSGIFIYYFIQHPWPEMVVFGLLQILLFVFWFFYRKKWDKILESEDREARESLEALETLKQKHLSRLESLHHLEKQVAGLLDLFEIARDFNDCLSLEAIAAIIAERVRPELPFQEMFLVFDEKAAETAPASRVVLINERGVQDHLHLDDLSPNEIKKIRQTRESKKMFHEDADVTFPILVDQQASSFLLLNGINPDDLAKFEVLAAYLTLQIKKVRLYEEVKELSIHDGLTGVYVRRHFLERFHEELARSIKYDLPLAVFMLDIDHFKRYNDTYGHLAGDATLKQVAGMLRENLRRVDIIARYGGEEFIVVTPETKKTEALEVAERIRSNIARHNFKVYNDQTRVTVSIGVSIYSSDKMGAGHETDVTALTTQLIHRADQALYRAKEDGRNRVICSPDL